MPSLGKKYAMQMGLPLQAENSQFGAVALIIFSVSLMMLGRFEAQMIERLRISISDVATPTLALLSHPVGTVRDIGGTLVGLASLQEENIRLRESLSRLQRWQTVAHSLAQENNSLKELLHYRAIPWPSFISAKVVAGSGNSFVRSALISAGRHDGVANGQAVMTGPGLVGRVVQVGEISANVLLLTDLNSRVPVIVGNGSNRAILAGDNTDIPYLDLLPGKAGIKVGMRVTTSGHGGKLPPGLPIGRVSRVSGTRIAVQPFVNFARLEHVVVVDWFLESQMPLAGISSGNEREGVSQKNDGITLSATGR
jgi:rod shape-determining protein MreC